ncbi:MAG: MarR family winged helix-turn-helix transcriptional regulator [Gaiellaceae bacterium]
MTIPADQLGEVRQLLRRVIRGLRHRSRPPDELLALVGREPPLGRRHLAVLAHLATDGPRTVGEIATELGLTLPAASKLARDLEDHTLVYRREHPDDRRRTLVDLNSLTRTQVTAWIERRDRPIEHALAGLSDTDREAFLKGLRALAGALVEESACGPLRSHDRPPHRRGSHRHRPL